MYIPILKVYSVHNKKSTLNINLNLICILDHHFKCTPNFYVVCLSHQTFNDKNTLKKIPVRCHTMAIPVVLIFFVCFGSGLSNNDATRQIYDGMAQMVGDNSYNNSWWKQMKNNLH